MTGDTVLRFFRSSFCGMINIYFFIGFSLLDFLRFFGFFSIIISSFSFESAIKVKHSCSIIFLYSFFCRSP